MLSAFCRKMMRLQELKRNCTREEMQIGTTHCYHLLMGTASRNEQVSGNEESSRRERNLVAPKATREHIIGRRFAYHILRQILIRRP